MTYAPIKGVCPVCHQDSANAAFQAGASSRDAEIATMKAEKFEAGNNQTIFVARISELSDQVTLLRNAATRARRKLSAYVGVCTGDKELTNTIIPMLKEAIAATEPKP